MPRKLFAPLLLALFPGCQGDQFPSPETPQASVPLELEVTLVRTQKSSAEPVAGASTGSAVEQEVDEPIPVEKGPDPEGWIPLEEIGGKQVDTVRRYYPWGSVRRIRTQFKGALGPLGFHGRDLSLHENGAWSQEAFWENGKLQGSYREWFEGGSAKIDSYYQAGLRHGTQQEFGERGRLRMQGEYREGRLHGVFQQWFEKGEAQETSHWKDGILSGNRRIWDRELTPIVNENFQDGVRHGEAIVYHRIPGQENVHQAGLYQQGFKVGAWVEFNAEGEKVQEKFFEHGKVTGTFKEWRKGVLTLDTHYIGSVENGIRSEFYASGKRFSRGSMKDGAREGAWFYWEEDGSVQSTWSGIYLDSKKVSALPSDDSVEDSNNE
jgi:antitoxin component YwqK of YwqJK toxin-antitoxin module